MSCENVSISEVGDIKLSHGFCYRFDTRNSAYNLSFASGTYFITLYGAAGGTTKFLESIYTLGAYGGMVSGSITFITPKKLFLHVGSRGSDSNGGISGKGGYNGGADGGEDLGNNHDCASAGSGGATDIRTEEGLWNSKFGLRSRIMVAGAGGSPGCFQAAGKGGVGGGVTGGDGEDSSADSTIKGGKGGSQTQGAEFGFGERGSDGSVETKGEAGGAGGSGYWGGFHGGTGDNNKSGAGGGGGSSFISGHPECVAINRDGSKSSSSIHFSKLRFTGTITKPGVNPSDGYAIIIGLGRIPCQTKHLTYNFLSYLFPFTLILIK